MKPNTESKKKANKTAKRNEAARKQSSTPYVSIHIL